MSIAGILGSSLSSLNTQNITSPRQQFQQELQQLGQDLQAGNLSAAQADFATLQQNAPAGSTTSTQSNNPIAQAFTQLGKDLQSGNLSAAQQDYSTIQQDVQSQSSQVQQHHRHHGARVESQDQPNPVAQEFSQLSQALQSGNLSAAQQAYSTLQQSFQAFTGTDAFASPTASSSSTSGFQVTA
jgi:outer membrane protein assembly factor BamD (BamD/ComL family)